VFDPKKKKGNLKREFEKKKKKKKKTVQLSQKNKYNSQNWPKKKAQIKPKKVVSKKRVSQMHLTANWEVNCLAVSGGI
jgi:hypothetical protein